MPGDVPDGTMPTDGGTSGGSAEPGFAPVSGAGEGEGRTAGLELDGPGSEEARCTEV
ncbi:MAG TPA: hypothetical protein VHQ44_06875 [Thermoanaerobaculia bacterium]|nr:hypothetical protein [Thermoanaerobaculia bacterium]